MKWSIQSVGGCAMFLGGGLILIATGRKYIHDGQMLLRGYALYGPPASNIYGYFLILLGFAIIVFGSQIVIANHQEMK